MTGLRERKRQRTHEALSEAAISLFLARGYDQVSVADVAAAAEVSKPTLFKYFASKEDLVLHRIADHQGEAARVVRQRPAAVRPLPALREHFLSGLLRHDPVTGLNDNPDVLAYHRMVLSTPSLAARVAQYMAADADALAAALLDADPSGDELIARLAATQIVAVQQVLARENGRLLTEGRAIARLLPIATAAADTAFDLLTDGLGGYAG